MTSRWTIITIAFAIQTSLINSSVAGRIHAHPEAATERSIVNDASVFDGYVVRREEHPREFARFHPYLNRLLNHPDLAAQWISEWESEPGVYETKHHFYWIILERYFFTEAAMQRMADRRFTSDDPTIIPPTYTGPILNDPAGDPPGDPPAVPEPASLTLAAIGLISLVGLATSCRIVLGKTVPVSNILR